MSALPKLTLATQLVLVQLLLIVGVLVSVSAVSVEQGITNYQRVEGRRVLAVAESVAGDPTVRRTPFQTAGAALPARVMNFQSTNSLDIVALADPSGRVIVSSDPRLADNPMPWPELIGDAGRARSGLVRIGKTEYVIAAAPVFSNPDNDKQTVTQLGIAITARANLTRTDALAMAAPTLLTYLGAALVLGVVGSLLLARWVKRQTLGMEPADMVALTEQRQAIFSGIAEGVLSLDLSNRITFVNPLAINLLSLPANPVGQSLDELKITGRLRDVLTASPSPRADQVVIRAGKVLVLNRKAISHQGRALGSVTTLRDRTELAELESELGAFRGTTHLLRAQTHEFANQLHTISGLIQIGEYDEVVEFVNALTEQRTSLDLAVSQRVQDLSVAALLIAKAAYAAEKRVTLRISDRTGLTPLQSSSSFDVATVLGNLIDNGIDAVSSIEDSERWVSVEIRQSDTTVELRVADSGPGIAEKLATEVFLQGYTTKAAEQGGRGIGLALTRYTCRRRGGEVVAHNTSEGALFIARMSVAQADPVTAGSDGTEDSAGSDAGAARPPTGEESLPGKASEGTGNLASTTLDGEVQPTRAGGGLVPGGRR